MGLEPTNGGTTIRCLNPLATLATVVGHYNNFALKSIPAIDKFLGSLILAGAIAPTTAAR